MDQSHSARVREGNKWWPLGIRETLATDVIRARVCVAFLGWRPRPTACGVATSARWGARAVRSHAAVAGERKRWRTEESRKEGAQEDPGTRPLRGPASERSRHQAKQQAADVPYAPPAATILAPRRRTEGSSCRRRQGRASSPPVRVINPSHSRQGSQEPRRSAMSSSRGALVDARGLPSPQHARALAGRGGFPFLSKAPGLACSCKSAVSSLPTIIRSPAYPPRPQLHYPFRTSPPRPLAYHRRHGLLEIHRSPRHNHPAHLLGLQRQPRRHPRRDPTALFHQRHARRLQAAQGQQLGRFHLVSRLIHAVESHQSNHAQPLAPLHACRRGEEPLGKRRLHASTHVCFFGSGVPGVFIGLEARSGFFSSSAADHLTISIPRIWRFTGLP